MSLSARIEAIYGETILRDARPGWSFDTQIGCWSRRYPHLASGCVYLRFGDLQWGTGFNGRSLAAFDRPEVFANVGPAMDAIEALAVSLGFEAVPPPEAA